MRCVYHVDSETAAIEIDGRVLLIPPNELYEVPEIRGNDFNNNGAKEYIVPDHFVCSKIIEHGWYHGLVEVPMVKTKTGLTADVDAGRKAAEAALTIAHDKILLRYVTDQQERVTQHNKPAMAPNGRVLKVINLRGINLKKEFNIDPPGYTIEKSHDRDLEIATLKAQMAQLLARLGEPAEAAAPKRSR